MELVLNYLKIKEWQEKNGTKEFITYSSNKEDLEAIIQEKKYNI